MPISRPTPRAPFLALLALLLFAAALLAGCGGSSSDVDAAASAGKDKGKGAAGEKSARPAESEVERVDYPQPRDEVEAWDGKVVLKVEGDANEEATRVLDDGAFDRVVEAVNDNLYLPNDITVRVTDDPEVVDSQYDYGTGVVSYPWEDFTETRELLEQNGYEDEGLDEAAIAANQYFLAREIGHAVADQLSLPTIGRLEDAVDGFGSYVGTNLLEDTGVAAAAAGVYASYSEQGEAGEFEWAQGYSVDQQRYFTTVCQAYGAEAGADENPYEFLVEESEMGTERAEGCAREWAEMDRSWETLLAPYLAEVDTDKAYAVPSADDVADWDGEFVLEYENEDSDEAEAIKEGGELQEVVDGLNASIALPVDVQVRVGDPDAEEFGPYYDGEHTIHLPWGYVELTRTSLEEFGYKGKELDQGVRDSAAGTLLHEAGHAVANLLLLPVVGREEDSADSFEIYAALGLLEQPQFGIADADVMGDWSNDADVDRSTYVDVHAIDAQRYYQAYCQIYGSDEEQFEYLVEGDTFDEDRLAECPDEWVAVEHGWDTLLAPFLKE